MTDFWRNFYPTVMVVWIAKLRVFEHPFVYLYLMVISWDSPPMNVRLRWILTI